MFLSRGDRDLGVAFQTHPGRQAFISSGSKEARSALESRRVSLGAHWVDSRESSLLRYPSRDWSLGHAGDEGPHLSMTGESRGCSRAAGVKILSSLGCVEEICFGSETGDIAPLLEAEARLSSPAFQNALAKTLSENRNISHRAAMTAVYRSLYGADSALTGSNDILALSYLAALREQKSPLKPTTVKRIGEAYNGEGEGFSSATSIREMLKRHDLEAVKRAVPQKCAEILIKSAKNGEICDEERLFSLFALLARTREDLLLEIPDIPSELAFRMIKSAKIAKNTEEFLSLAETKLYSRSRIRRGMLYAAIGVKKEDFDKVLYTTVLAANQTGREILSRIRKTAQIPIITKPADAVNFGEDVSRAFALSARADSVWELLLPAPHSGERMMREHPRML